MSAADGEIRDVGRTVHTGDAACGLVTAWDPRLVEQAQQFAQAHRRRYVEWPTGATLEALVEWIGPSASLTVFVYVRQMTYQVLQSLTLLSVRRELPLGLIPCAPESQIPLSPAPNPQSVVLRQRSLLYSHFFAGQRVPGIQHTHGRPAWEAFLTEAARGGEVMVLHTHSNGADAPIGGTILCSRVDGLPTSSQRRRCLPCFAGGPCIREHRDARWYFSPSYLRCRALVFLSCTGFPPADSLLRYEGSLVQAALRGGMIRSVVTSIRVAGSATFALALSSKEYIDAGHSMGALALAINHADAEQAPHYICIGDPEYCPIQGPLELVPMDDDVPPAPPAIDTPRAYGADVVLAEAELLARTVPPQWGSVEDRAQAIHGMAHRPADAGIDTPRLIGARGLPLEHWAERLEGAGCCPHCKEPTRRYRSRSQIARKDLRLECCREHGITAVEAPDNEHEFAPRAARWLFTAFTLRHIAEQLGSHRAELLDLAHLLEHGALSGELPPSSRELDCRIATLFGIAVTAGSEVFLTRHLGPLSTSQHGTTEWTHHCGQKLLHVDVASPSLRLRRRVWFCPLCGVIGNTLSEYALPEVAIEAERWLATPMQAPFAGDGCALTLAWERRGLCRDDWSTSIWINEPTAGPLPHSGHQDFGGVRSLDAIMVADTEVFTMRIPVFRSSTDRRWCSLRELNEEDAPAVRLP